MAKDAKKMVRFQGGNPKGRNARDIAAQFMAAVNKAKEQQAQKADKNEK